MSETEPKVAARSALSWLEEYCDESVEFLRRVHDPASGLFPYSTKVVDGEYVNQFDHPQTIRYSINTLLGLWEAARVRPSDRWLGDFDGMVETFMRRQFASIEDRADLGLLLVLLADIGGHPKADELAARVAGLATTTSTTDLDMQEAAWMLWGLTAWSRQNGGASSDAPGLMFERVLEHFVDEKTGLPRHSCRRYRRNIVSFGTVVHFLRSIDEYAAVTGDERASDLFERCVRRMLLLQGPLGEWPWLMNVSDGRVVDAYPVFAVHQDSMSMLFLLPALSRGMEGASEAILRSCAWVTGENELGRPMFERDPFRAFRSIERPSRYPRARRYVRAHTPGAAGAQFGARRVRINPECRSYHLGWVLYVWSARPMPLGEASSVAGRLAADKRVPR